MVSTCTDEELVEFIDNQIGSVFPQNMSLLIENIKMGVDNEAFDKVTPMLVSISEKAIPYIKINLDESRQFFKYSYKMMLLIE